MTKPKKKVSAKRQLKEKGAQVKDLLTRIDEAFHGGFVLLSGNYGYSFQAFKDKYPHASLVCIDHKTLPTLIRKIEREIEKRKK